MVLTNKISRFVCFFFLYIFLVGDENMGAHIAVVCLLFFSLVVVLHGVLWPKTRKKNIFNATDLSSLKISFLLQ